MGAGAFSGIQIIVDCNAPSVYLLSDLGFYGSGQPLRMKRPALIGSVDAWGEWIAFHLAAAYKPEGVP